MDAPKYWTREVQRLVQDKGYSIKNAVAKVKERKRRYEEATDRFNVNM